MEKTEPNKQLKIVTTEDGHNSDDDQTRVESPQEIETSPDDNEFEKLDKMIELLPEHFPLAIETIKNEIGPIICINTGIFSVLKPSGNMLPGRGARQRLVSAMIKSDFQTTLGIGIIRAIRPIRWGKRNPMPGGCTTCTAMFMSGARIGMVIILSCYR